MEIFNGYAFSAAGKAAEELSLPAGYFTWVQAIWLFDAEPFTVTQFMRCFPYGLAQVNHERFASAVQQGYLASDGQEVYRATESGRTAALRLIQAGIDLTAPLTPMPKELLRTLGSLLARISGEAFHSPELPAHILMKAKQDFYERTGAFAVLEGIATYCLMLEGHRDDCYFATWSAHGMEGHTWEVLDQLSQSDALTFDELHEKTSGRGVTREVHAEDVVELVGRGWADDASRKIQITLAGKQVRAEVEAETERLFFAPWSCLDETELEELASLASQLRDGLKI
ncbi:MAG: hypothetical protein HND47_24550 [Chloroflexi bacterium]|nr:hypothetical protein [Chloroflexota bacterium]